ATASQNIRKIQGPGSAGSFFDAARSCSPASPRAGAPCSLFNCISADTGAGCDDPLDCGSPGGVCAPGAPGKAPARSYGEVQGVFGAGRGMGSMARRGAGGLPVRNLDMPLNESGAESFEDIFGPNETPSRQQAFPITAANPEILANRRDSYQVNIIAFLRESEDPAVPAMESYGYGIDDVVVEWREQHPVADRTPCSNPSTWAAINVCSNDATQTCSNDTQCGSGTCGRRSVGRPSQDPGKASGCAGISWDRTAILDPETSLTLTVIDRNAQVGPDGFAGTGDEQADDDGCVVPAPTPSSPGATRVLAPHLAGDGLPELTVQVNAPGIDQLGERFCLEEIAPNTGVYEGIVGVSSKSGLTSSTDGVIFIQENGKGDSPTTVVASYADADINVTGIPGDNVPCPDNPLQAAVSTRLVGQDVMFVTAQVMDDPALSPNNDGDFIADAGETVDLRITAINTVLDLGGQKVDLENVTLTLMSNDPDVACIINGSSSFGRMLSGMARTNEGADYRVVIGNTKRTSPAQLLQAEFILGIQGEFTDSEGIRRQVSSFTTPQRFAINLDMDVVGTAAPLMSDAACQGASTADLNGRACNASSQCGDGSCVSLPLYLQSGPVSCDQGTGACSGGPDDGGVCALDADCPRHPLAGQVGYFEGFEGSPRTDSLAQPGGGPLIGTSFRHQPAIFPDGGGFLQQRVVGFSTGAGGPGSGEGLTPGSVLTGPDKPQGRSAVDGSRCQQHAPQGPQRANRSESRCRPFEFSSWHIVDYKAFSGTNALYGGVSGIDVDPSLDASFDGTFTGYHAAALTRSLHVGVSGGAMLSIQHIVQTADDRTFNSPSTPAAGRAYLEVAPADSAGDIAGAWTKIAGFQNNYGHTAVQPFFVNCIFSNYDEFYDAKAALGNTPGFDPGAVNVVGVEYNADDVASEDDYFDPNDPTRNIGPSNGCFPQFVYSSMGNYDAEALGLHRHLVGRAFTEGRLGSNGTGVWINSLFNLDSFAGQSIIVRFMLTDIEVAPDLLWIDIFANVLGNAFRGWIMDDVAVSGLVDAPLGLVNDSRPAPAGNACPVDPDLSTPGNENACGSITADAGPDQFIPLAGTRVTLDAGNSSADRCIGGVLQYRWRIGTEILQDFSTSSRVVDAPAGNTLYTVDVRCSTDPACSASDEVMVMAADLVAASSTAEGMMTADGGGAFVAQAPPGGSMGGPYELFLFRTNSAAVRAASAAGSKGQVAATLCDLGKITPSPIAAGTPAPPYRDTTPGGALSPRGPGAPPVPVLMYLAAARTAGLGADPAVFDTGDVTGTLGEGKAPGASGLLPRGSLQVTLLPATARGNCP
ncbi:MAG: hypothetical protein ACE5ID_03285, partial [Acidobacteriota bacterium]